MVSANRSVAGQRYFTELNSNEFGLQTLNSLTARNVFFTGQLSEGYTGYLCLLLDDSSSFGPYSVLSPTAVAGCSAFSKIFRPLRLLLGDSATFSLLLSLQSLSLSREMYYYY